MEMKINEETRTKLINNLNRLKNEVNENIYIKDHILPLGIDSCYFCLLLHDCDKCEYSKKYGKCGLANSRYQKIRSSIKDFRDQFSHSSQLGIERSNLIKRSYDYHIKIIYYAKNVNEIMMTKKSLIRSIIAILGNYHIDAQKIIDFTKCIDENYWENEEELKEIRVYDLKDSIKNKMVKFGYKEDEILSEVNKKLVTIGQKIMIKFGAGAIFIGYVIKSNDKEALIINENHKHRWYNSYEVDYIDDCHITIESFEKIFPPNSSYEFIDE